MRLRLLQDSSWWRTSCHSLFVFLCVVGQAAAAPPASESGRRYTLSECIQTALVAHPDVQEARWNVEIARMHVEEADRGRYPDVQYTQLFGVVNEAKGDILNPRNQREDFLNGLGPFTKINFDFTLPLYTFGKISAGKSAARSGLQTEEADRTARENDVIFEVKRLYFGLLLARQVHDLLDKIASNLSDAVTEATDRLEKGDASVSQRDVLKVRLGYATLAQEARKALTGRDLARAGLMRALSLDREAPFDLATRRLEPATVNLKTLQEYVDDLFRHNPQWERLHAGIEAQSAQVRMARSDYFPALFLAGGVGFAVAPNRTEQDNPFANDEFNFLQPGGALGLHWSLNFLSTRLQVEGAEAELAKLHVQERAAKIGLPLEAEKAYAGVLEARDKIRLAADGRRAGRALYASAIASFTLGIGKAEDLFTLLGGYVRAATDYWQAIFDYNVALAELTKSIGVEVTTLDYERPQSTAPLG